MFDASIGKEVAPSVPVPPSAPWLRDNLSRGVIDNPTSLHKMSMQAPDVGIRFHRQDYVPATRQGSGNHNKDSRPEWHLNFCKLLYGKVI